MTTIPTPAPVPDPLASDFAAKCYPFTVWQAEAAVAMNAVAGEINTALNQSLLGVTSSSTTSLPITVTAKVLTVGTGLSYVEGMPLKLSSKANVDNYIKGVVTAYNTITGQLNLLAKSVRGSGTFDDWSVSFDVPDTSVPKISNLARTSNVMLMNADSGSLVSATSSFTQTFDTANFEPGWYIYIKNAGTGEITIPSSDGVTNWKMYSNELRLFIYDGTNLRSVVLATFNVTFTSSDTFVKPPCYNSFGGLLWGAGAGGGACRTSTATVNQDVLGGVGGACHPFSISANNLPATVSVVIGAGGAGGVAPTNSVANGASGGDSSFASFTGFGGGFNTGGSGILSKGTFGGAGGAPNGGNRSVLPTNNGETGFITSYVGGGYSGNISPASTNTYSTYSSGSYYGSAGTTGCYGSGSQYTTPTPASSTVYGGGTGQCLAMGAVDNFLSMAKGTTVYGGAGGDADRGTGVRTGVAGGVRGGGGGAAWSTNNVSATGGAGGRGELQIWGVV